MQLPFELRKQFKISHFEISINWLIAACVLMTMATFINLAFWQLDRAAEKVEAQRLVQAEQQQNAIDIRAIPRGHIHPSNPEMQNRHVALTGEYLNERSILLLAEFHQGQIGYGVVTPFRLAETEQLVLIHRGWTTGILPPNTEPDLRPVYGQQEITGQVFVPAPDARVISSQVNAADWPVRMRSLEFDIIEQLLAEELAQGAEQELFPFQIRLTENQAGVFVRHWPAVNIDVNGNLSYALQWFCFALATLLIALFASSNLWRLLRG